MLSFKRLIFILLTLFVHNLSAQDIGKYEKITEEIVKVYKPIAEIDGHSIKFRWLLDKPTRNITGNLEGETWLITIYGGLLFHPKMTYEAFRVIMCHEIGHIIGGEPTFHEPPSSNSGQPDYYATMICMKLLLEDKDNSNFANEKVDKVLQERCAKTFSDKKDHFLCIRSGMASLELTGLLSALHSRSKPPEYGTPSSNVVDVVQSSHPETQCRLDTLLAGILCTVKPIGKYSSEANDMNKLCARGVSSRPRCWFIPEPNDRSDPERLKKFEPQ